MRDFIKQTGQDRDYFGEQNYPKGNYRNSLTFSANSGTINDNKKTFYINSRYYKGKAEIQKVTSEGIDRIPFIKFETLSDEKSLLLQQAGKDILNYVKNEIEGTEAFIAYNMDMKEIERNIGNANDLKISVPPYDDDRIVIHNHPSCLIFSPKDLERFSDDYSIQILGAIGNNGNVYYIEKTDDFDYNQYNFEYYILKNKYGSVDNKGKYKFNSDNDLFKFIEEFMDRGDTIGFKTYIKTNN